MIRPVSIALTLALTFAAQMTVRLHSASTVEQLTAQLHQQIMRDDFQKVVDLVNQGADVTLTLGGATALGLALDNFHSNRRVLNYILEKGAKRDLLTAIAIGTEEEIQKLAKSKSSLELRTPLRKSPIHLATHYKRSTKVIDLLLNAGADIDAPDQFDRTAMSWSMQNGPNSPLPLHLINRGANVNSRDGFGQSPLYYAASYGLTEVVKELIKKGADVNAPGQQGRTPLHMAVQYNHTEIAELLIQNGADINAKTTRGDTPLSAARKARLQEMIDFLLKSVSKDSEIPKPPEIPGAATNKPPTSPLP